MPIIKVKSKSKSKMKVKVKVKTNKINVKQLNQTFYKIIDSPVGPLKLIANNNSLLAVLWPKDKPGRTKVSLGKKNDSHPVLKLAEKQLKEYFAGERKAFDLPLEMTGTDFQKKVWQGLCLIPFGKTQSYVELATKIGSPKAVRAAGSANGRNPLSIVVPCHRVIGKNGTLTGFAGGLDAKDFLLKLESQ